MALDAAETQVLSGIHAGWGSLAFRFNWSAIGESAVMDWSASALLQRLLNQRKAFLGPDSSMEQAMPGSVDTHKSLGEKWRPGLFHVALQVGCAKRFPSTGVT
jgi:hypothetical protein